MNLSGLNTFTSADKILIDTNILIYVYCPLNSKNCESFARFINRWLRLDYEKSGLGGTFKKDYRLSDRYKTTMKTILKELSKFYKHCSVRQLGDSFSIVDFQDKYKSFPESDFNDIIIAENAKINDCKILTQDGDFAQYGVKVIK